MAQSGLIRGGSRTSRLLIGLPASIALIYAALLIPEASPNPPRGAGKKPFLWNEDRVWTGLETNFAEAKAAGCDNIRRSADQALVQLDVLVDQISTNTVVCDDPSLSALELGLFQAAPLVAACPEQLPRYIELATRARSAIKRQSANWDLNSSAVRERLYRILFGARLALEEVVLQGQSAGRSPPVMVGANVPPQTASISVEGVTLHSGDILVSRGGAPTSALIARGNDFPGSFSHVALLHIDEQTRLASLIESHIERGVAIATLDEYLADKKLRILVLRLRPDLPEMIADPMLPHRAATAALATARQHHIPYDFAMDYRDHRAQFCSEVASAAYEPVGIHLWKGTTTISSPAVVAWLASVGVKYFETQEPADLEYDPQISVVAEWFDPDALLRAHIDDAVIDAMLEAAAPGKGLPYEHRLLPVTRLAKAFSVMLNCLGKVGPIPEGMSATTALRVQKFRRDHARLAHRVLVEAEKFKLSKGYNPPFWELTRMATDAVRSND